MRRLVASRWTHIAIWTSGFLFLVAYLTVTGDWRVSVPWALAYVAISISLSCLISVVLRLHERLPILDRYLLFDHEGKPENEQVTRDEWNLEYVKYHLDTGLRTKAFLLSPAEDGFICVPVMLMGIGPLQATIGGAVFGIVHLGRFTYLDCIGKAVIYGLICYYVLPHGVLTVVLGHFMMNGMAFAFMQLAERQLKKTLRSNSTVETDARKGGARGSL